MPSEYDFLAPVSGTLRRAGILMAAGGAFVAGMICTGLVVALTMKSADEGKALFTTASERSVPAQLSTPKAIKSAQTVPVSPAPGTAAAAPLAPEAKPELVGGSPGTERAAETTGQSSAPPKPVPAARTAAVTAATDPADASSPAPEPRTQVATTDSEAKPDKARKRVKRARAPRSHAKAERRRGEDREAVREFVDPYGRRTVVLPRRWDDSDRRALARERPYDRSPGMVFGPGPYYSRY